MPLYDIQCKTPTCGVRSTIFRKIAEMDNLPACASCAGETQRILSAPTVHAAFSAYVSPATGKMIESRQAQRADLCASGHFLNEPGVKKDIARNKLETEEKAFQPIAAGVDAVVHKLVNTGALTS
jgi:putative FmdB family regulatory protein